MYIKDIMTINIVSVPVDENLKNVAELMKNNHIGLIPVYNEDKVVGVVTDRDIVLRSIAEGKCCEDQKVRDIMTTNPVLGDCEMSLEEAANLMGKNQIRRLPIVKEGELVGIVSLGDLSLEDKCDEGAKNALKEISKYSSSEN